MITNEFALQRFNVRMSGQRRPVNPWVMAALLIVLLIAVAAPNIASNLAGSENLQKGTDCIERHGAFAAWRSADGQLRMLCQPPGTPDIFKVNAREVDGQWVVKYVEKFDNLAEAIARSAKNAERLTAEALKAIGGMK